MGEPPTELPSLTAGQPSVGVEGKIINIFVCHVISGILSARLFRWVSVAELPSGLVPRE